MYLLDTNVVSEGMRARSDANVDAWLASVDEEHTFISTVSIAELRRGFCMLPAGRKRNELEKWLHADVIRRFDRRVIDVTTDIAVAWGDMMGLAKFGGFGLQIMDCFIAATAKARSMTLVTRNVKDFSRLKIDLFNPWQPRSTR